MDMLVLDIKEPGNRRETQKSIARAARDLLSADWGAMVTLNPITRKFHGKCVATGDMRERDLKPVAEWLEGIALEAVKSERVYEPERLEPPEVSVGGFDLRETASLRVVTFRTKWERSPVAVLFVGSRARRQLTPEEDSGLSALISQSSSVLENIWLLGRYRDVISIGQKLNRKVNGYRELFEKLHEAVASILDTSYFFMLGVYQPHNDKLDRYFSLEKGRPVVQMAMELEGASEAAIRKGRTLRTFDRSRDPEWKVEHVDLVGKEKPDPESEIFEPLLFRGEVLGVLSVQHPQPHAFDEEDVRIMKLLGNQVALALSNLRLFKYLETLNDVGQRLTESLSSEDLLAQVAEEVKGATGADIITLYPYLPEDRFADPIYFGDVREPEYLLPKVRTDNIAWLALKKGTPVWARNSTELYAMLGGDAKSRGGKFETREEVKSTAAVSLQIGNEAVGVLFANFRTQQRFPSSQRNLIMGLANYAAIAIKNYRKYTALDQRRLEDLEALQKIDRQMRKNPGLKQILYTILEGAVNRIPSAHESSIFLYNPRTEQLETAASIGEHKELYQDLSLPVKGGRGITVWVYNNRQQKRIADVRADPDFRDIYCPVIDETRSEMDFPLMDDDEVAGVISFESKREGAFSKEDEDFISTLAGQAVLAIKTAQLSEMAETARQEVGTLHEVALRITSMKTDPEEVMKFILGKARALLGAEMGALQLYEGSNEGVRPGKVYISQTDAEDGEPVVETIEPGDTEGQVKLGIVQRVAETREPYIAEGDAALDFYYKGSPDYHSEIAVPLISRDGTLIGVLDLESPRLYAFDREHLEMLGTFGRQAVVAIQYAQLYSRARADSTRFRLLFEAGRDLGKLTDISQLGEAYDIVVNKVKEFNDGEIILRRFDEASQDLVLERLLNPQRTEPPERIPVSMGINGQVAREHRTVVVHDLNDLPPDVAESFADDPNVRTLAVTPVKSERYYGNLVLSHEKPFSLGPADISLLEGLAQHLAITIYRLEMVHEKREAEEQAKNLEIVGEFGQSTLEIAHRLGNELGLIRVYINNIRQAISSFEIESAAIDKELDKVLRDVGNVLNISKGLKQKVAEIGKEGKLGEGRATVPVRSLLEDSSWTVPLPDNIKLEWELADDLAQVNVIAGQIVDILRNLVANAMEVMPDGGRINIRAYNAPPDVRIEVEDTGPGIPHEYQPKIFNLFVSTKKSSGFGLWSARRYARANGGDLSLRSEPGSGATFILSLPLLERAEGAGEPPSNE